MYVTKQIQNKLHKKKINLHQRSILRQMMNTCDKLENSFLSRVQQKKFEEKEKQEKQLSRKTSFIEKENFQQRFSHNPLRCAKQNFMDEFVYVKQSKEIKQIKDLKEKMLPKVNKTNIQRKLKELSYIRNMGFRSKNKKLESFKLMTRQKDEENILNKSWEEFYQDKLFNSPTQTPKEKEEIVRHFQRKRTKNPTFILKKEKNDFNNAEKETGANSLSETLNTFSQSSPSRFKKESPRFAEIPRIDFSKTNYASNPSTGFFSTAQNSYHENHTENENFTKDQDMLSVDQTEYKQRQSRVSTRNKTGFKDLIKSLPRKTKMQLQNPNYAQHLMSTDRKKQITQKMGLTKEKLQKQNAFKLYSLIKGGYELDRNDVEGEFISMKRFKEAKQNFKILNNCFDKVRHYRYIIQEPQKVFNDGSFKSLVYLSQIENKIPHSVFRKVQQLNQVVD